jgi:hypothetical protein
MKKKQYTSPLVEAIPVQCSRCVMETSIFEPSGPGGAPERRNWWLF